MGKQPNNHGVALQLIASLEQRLLQMKYQLADGEHSLLELYTIELNSLADMIRHHQRQERRNDGG